MSSTITVREDPGDKSWLKREAREVGVSMEEFVRRLTARSASNPRTHRPLTVARFPARAAAAGRAGER